MCTCSCFPFEKSYKKVTMITSRCSHTHTDTHTATQCRNNMPCTHTHAYIYAHAHTHTCTHTISRSPKYHQQSKTPVSLHCSCKLEWGREGEREVERKWTHHQLVILVNKALTVSEIICQHFSSTYQGAHLLREWGCESLLVIWATNCLILVHRICDLYQMLQGKLLMQWEPPNYLMQTCSCAYS